MRLKLIVIPALFFLVGIMSTSCSSRSIRISSSIDTPSHHVTNGMRFMEAGKPEDAYREFYRAIELNPQYAQAYVGIGLVKGILGREAEGLFIIKTAMALLKGEKTQIPVISKTP